MSAWVLPAAGPADPLLVWRGKACLRASRSGSPGADARAPYSSRSVMIDCGRALWRDLARDDGSPFDHAERGLPK